ncbi:hypothetical protein [Pseudomonas fragi]|nr:hypothetical protein [Pseudomonas fragi]MCK6254252.1 hypothetical protein [Pseudomonas fragi]
MNRTQVLMSGHLTQGDARATFFYSDLLARAKLYRQACRWGAKVDALIDRRPPSHLGQYVTWIQQVAEQHGHAPLGAGHEGFENAVKLCSKLDDDYKQLLKLPPAFSHEYSAISGGNGIDVINIFDCLCHEMDVLNSQVLMFVEGPWNIKMPDIEEPQAAVVLLGAHLQGLRGTYQYGVEYSIGADAYLRRASQENQSNERFKGQLVQRLGASFNTPKRIRKLHGVATQYLGELHGVNNEQLGCFICSPFVNKADDLEPFLQNCYPEKLQYIQEYRRVLMDPNTSSQVDVTWLESVSGLPLASLQALYHMEKIDVRTSNSLIATLCAHDPSKKPWHTALAG